MAIPGATFPRAPRLRKGYDPAHVDRFLARAAAALGGAPGAAPLTAQDVRRVGFPLVRRGYVVGAVDEHLDRLEERALAAEGAQPPPGSSRARPTLLAEVLSGRRGRRFPRVRWWRGGYSRSEVDAFLGRIRASLAGGAGAPPLPAAVVRAAVFHVRRAGYAEAAVDDALDLVVDLLLRREIAARR